MALFQIKRGVGAEAMTQDRMRKAPGGNLLSRLLVANASETTLGYQRKRPIGAFSVIAGLAIAGAVWLGVLWGMGVLR